MVFWLNHIFSGRIGWRLQPIFRQFVNLINHNIDLYTCKSSLYRPLYLQTKTKLRKSLKDILNCCKLQILFTIQNKLAKLFALKIVFPRNLHLVIFYKFQCGFCNKSYYGKCVRHLNVRIGEHIGISPLAKKKSKPKRSFFTLQPFSILWKI